MTKAMGFARKISLNNREKRPSDGRQWEEEEKLFRIRAVFTDVRQFLLSSSSERLGEDKTLF